MALDIERIVRITDELTPTTSIVGRNLGKTLFVREGASSAPTISGAADALRDREVRSYSTLLAVADDYDAADTAYRAAQTYFSQSPYPGDFAVGTYFPTGRPGIIAATIVATQDQLRAAHSFSVFGETVSYAAGNSRTTVASVGTALAAALNGVTGWSGFTVTDRDGTALTGNLSATNTIEVLVNVPATVAASHNVLVDAPGDGTNSSDLFGFSGSGLVAYVAPARTHSNSIANALDDIRTQDDSWYWLCIEPGLVAGSAEAASAYVEAVKKFFVVADSQASALATNDSTSRLAVMSTAQRQRTSGIYSGTADYKDVSLAGFFSSVDYDAPNSVVTANLGSLTGTAPDAISEAQRTELRRKRVNYYDQVSGGVNVLREGWSFARWIDDRAFIDWLIGAIQLELFNTLRTARRVPFTNAGLAQINAAISTVCGRGVANGGLAPGEVSPVLRAEIASVTGISGFDGVLSAGYLVHTPAVADISSANQDSRTAAGFRVFARGSSAIHNIELHITFR